MKLVNIGFGNLINEDRVIDIKAEVEKIREQIQNIE